MQSDLCTSSVDELLDFLLESPLLDPAVRVAHLGPQSEIDQSDPETQDNINHSHTSRWQKRKYDASNDCDSLEQSKVAKLGDTLSSEVDQFQILAPHFSNGGSDAKVKYYWTDFLFGKT